MSSLIEFRNLTFNGDQVTFDIHVNVPPGAGGWAGLSLFGTYNGIDPDGDGSAYFTYHTIDGESFVDNNNSNQIDIFTSTGNTLTSSSGKIATFSGPASVFMGTITYNNGYEPGAWDIGDLFQISGNPIGISSGTILTIGEGGYTDVTLDDITEGQTTPSGPEYSHIGNSSGGTSGVDTTTSNYDASTGAVEFFQGVDPSSSIEFLVVNNASLYVDNGNDDTGASDQTMGVYLDMGLGLASALVPSANKVTVPEAGVIKSAPTGGGSVDTPYVYFTNAHYTVSADGTHDVVEFDVMLNADAFKADYSDHIMGAFNFNLADEIASGGEDGTTYNALIIEDTWVTLGDTTVETSWGSGADPIAAFQWYGDDYFRVNQHYSMETDAGTPDYGLTEADAGGTHLLGTYSLAYDSTAAGYDSSWKPSVTGTDFDGENILSFFNPYGWSGNSTSGLMDFNSSDGTNDGAVAVDLVYIDSSSGGSGSDTILDTLDATVEDVNALPWVIALSEQDDIFIGRDAVYDDLTGTYDPGLEYVYATAGNDTIDGGGGLNAADFSMFGPSYGVAFDMSSGDVSIHTSTDSYTQKWHGFQIALGTDQNDSFTGTGEEDNAVPEEFMHFHFGDAHIQSGAGSNIMVSNGGGGTFVGNGGNDFLYLDGSSADSMAHYAYGGSGADIFAFGLGIDDVYGDGQDYIVSGLSEMNATDDFYNDEVTFAMFDIDEHGGSGLTPPTGTITFNTGSQSFSFDLAAGASWDDFVNEANKQMNLDLGNLVDDGSGNVTVVDGRTAYAYVVRETVDVYDTVVDDGSTTIAATSALKIYYGEGLVAPDIAGYHVPDTNESYDPALYPAGAPSATFVDPDHGGTVTYAADMFAPTMQFIEGTGDDNDVFVAYDMAFSGNTDDGVQHGIDSIDGDRIFDLDIGQNSLSLAADRGESIYFETGLIDQAATQISVSDDTYGGYTADVTLTDVNGNTASFTLDNLNGPTTALYGDQTYQLAAVWQDVGFDASVKEVGLGVNFDASNGATSLTELTFEWQGLGEKVGSNEVDMLTGSNGSNTFQAYGGDDVLNGAGGGDTYQFTGIFGNDKVLDFGNTGTDILQIGAGYQDVWLERKGRRGDELEITVNDGENVGTISVGRQFNPYTTIAAVEEIHFGFDGTIAQDVATIGNGMHGGDIKVLKDGEEHFHLHGDSGSVIYMNQNEGAATVKVTWRDSYSDTWDSSNPMYFDQIGLEIEYQNHEDEFFIELETDANGDYVAGGTGALHSLLSKSGISVVHQDGNQGINVGSSVNSDGYTEFQFTDADSGALLFALETIDAASWGV